MSSSEEEAFSSHPSSDEMSCTSEPEFNTSGKNNQKRSLASALSQVLQEKTPDDKPILHSRTHKRFKEEEERQVELKAKRLYKKEQREKLHTLRVKPCGETANAEKALKKMATAGVVQLFNAVYQAQQTITNKKTSKTPQGTSAKKEENAKAAPSAVNFMDLIKTGTTRII